MCNYEIVDNEFISSDPALPMGFCYPEEEELSECCSATILDNIWLCSDCKEPCE